MNDITLILAYYDNPEMLDHQLACLAELPIHHRVHVGLIVVDDCSPGAPAGEVVTQYRAAHPPPHGRLGCGMQVFRMDVDIRWNQDACRNLAVSQAKTKWLLLTDMDHIVLPETWARIITDRLSWKSVYTFSRVTGAVRSHRNPHPNTWLLTREMFDAAGGYDERFAGFYGTDGDFKRRIEKVGKIELLPERVHEITPDQVADCRTTAYGRKEAQDRVAIPQITRDRGAKPPIRGRFPWHQVF